MSSSKRPPADGDPVFCPLCHSRVTLEDTGALSLAEHWLKILDAPSLRARCPLSGIVVTEATA